MALSTLNALLIDSFMNNVIEQVYLTNQKEGNSLNIEVAKYA